MVRTGGEVRTGGRRVLAAVAMATAAVVVCATPAVAAGKPGSVQVSGGVSGASGTHTTTGSWSVPLGSKSKVTATCTLESPALAAPQPVTCGDVVIGRNSTAATVTLEQAPAGTNTFVVLISYTGGKTAEGRFNFTIDPAPTDAALDATCVGLGVAVEVGARGAYGGAWSCEPPTPSNVEDARRALIAFCPFPQGFQVEIKTTTVRFSCT